MKKKNIFKYSTLFIILGIVLVFIVVVSTSYAFFTTTVKGKELVIKTGTLAVNYLKKTDVINLTNLYPMTNSEGLNQTPHEFSITNNGNIKARYQIRLEIDNNNKNQVPIEYIKMSYKKDDNNYSTPVLLSDLNSSLVIIKDVVINPQEVNNYGIKLWIDLSAPNDIQNKTFKAKVVVDSIQDVEDGYVINTIPIINLNKDKNNNTDINLKVGETYTELGVESVEDDTDILTVNQVTKTYEYFDGTNLTTVDNIDTSKTGIYYVTYSVTDKDKNIGRITRIVTVNNTSTIPSITLNGESSITLGERDYYKEKGVTVKDNNKVITIGEVKTKSVGTYTVRYIVVDSNNNLNSVVRTVNVIKPYEELILNGTDPVLSDNLVPVKIQDDGTVKRASTLSEWYDYETKQWANAVVLKSNYNENKIYDLSGNSNHATIYGATKTDEGLYFDGIDDYAKIDLLKWNSANEFTIEFKAKIDIDKETADYASILFESSSDSNSNDSFFVDTEEHGTKDILMMVKDNKTASYDINYVNNVVNNNKYNTYTVTFDVDNNNKKYTNIYVNGEKQDISIYMNFNHDMSNFVLGDYPFFIASRNGQSLFSRMTLNSLKIYNRELTEDEIRNNFNNNITTDSLLVMYNFDGDTDYNYENNEIIPEDAIESYFVWIPKYSYQLWDLGNYSTLTSVDSTKPHAIPIKFGTTNTTDTNIGECTTPMNDSGTQGLAGESGNCKVGDYMTHPAFLAFDSEGFWVGKFETGYDGATSTSAAQTNTNKIDTNKIIIKPNVYSWRNINLGNMFENSYQYLRSDESHMMKNTEWGAVAYLSHSIYGMCNEVDSEIKCSEVRINNNSSYITGYSAKEQPSLGYNSGISIDGNKIDKTSVATDGTNTVNYLNNQSVLSSTTGNYSGIYDMAGGTWEYVMGYTTGASTIGGLSTITNIYNDFYVNNDYEKYYDKYFSTATANYNNRILGDATGELGTFATKLDPDNLTRFTSSWYGDYAHFASASESWFPRGDYWNGGSGAGMFAFYGYSGGAYIYLSFRIVLTP